MSLLNELLEQEALPTTEKTNHIATLMQKGFMDPKESTVEAQIDAVEVKETDPLEPVDLDDLDADQRASISEAFDLDAEQLSAINKMNAQESDEYTRRENITRVREIKRNPLQVKRVESESMSKYSESKLLRDKEQLLAEQKKELDHSAQLRAEKKARQKEADATRRAFLDARTLEGDASKPGANFPATPQEKTTKRSITGY